MTKKSNNSLRLLFKTNIVLGDILCSTFNTTIIYCDLELKQWCFKELSSRLWLTDSETSCVFIFYS